MPPQISKLAAAKRQLVTAIRLHFAEEDPVSVLSLAANAWEVIDELCKLRGVDSLSRETEEHVPDGLNLKKNFINSPYRNFFKHADRDPDDTIEPPPDGTVDGILMLAVEDYLRLNQRGPVELQVFQLWFLACHPRKVSDHLYAKVLERSQAAFPNIQQLARGPQLQMGAAVLRDMRKDPAIMGDARTEPS